MEIQWGTMIFQIFTICFVLLILGLLVYLVVKLATSNRKSEIGELNKKIDKLIELQERNNKQEWPVSVNFLFK